MSGFDDVRGPGGEERLCPRCQETNTANTAGHVLVALREARRGAKAARNVNSKTVTFCEACAVEVFTGLRDALLKEKK